MEINNLFEAIPDDLNEELFEVLQQNESVKIERIVSKGQCSPKTGWYEQAQNEWVIVIKGEATLEFEDKEMSMKEGSYINIPAHTKHKVSWTNPELETVWIAVHY